MFIFVCFSQEQSESPINVFVHDTAYFSMLGWRFCCQPAFFMNTVPCLMLFLRSICLPMVIEASRSCRLYRRYFCLMRSLIWTLCTCCWLRNRESNCLNKPASSYRVKHLIPCWFLCTFKRSECWIKLWSTYISAKYILESIGIRLAVYNSTVGLSESSCKTRRCVNQRHWVCSVT